jgi:hypothetical protein
VLPILTSRLVSRDGCGPFYLKKKTKMASIYGISGSAAILKIFHLNHINMILGYPKVSNERAT